METTPKVIQMDFRQKLVKCFYFERKAIKTQIGLTYKVINHTDNAVQKCNKSVHTQENSLTESHKNIKVNEGHQLTCYIRTRAPIGQRAGRKRCKWKFRPIPFIIPDNRTKSRMAIK